ncbi:Transmembrane protein 87A [Aphanomyces cochlioides]|nr:Transmembrane protein 87A [Aphanomyces cochlioides]
MTSIRRSVALSLWIVAAVVQASIHVVQGPSIGWRATERMFANPPGKNGSIVRVDFNATPIDPPSSDVDYAVVVAIFDLTNGSVVPDDYCSMDYTSLNMTDHIVGRVFSSDDANKNAVRGSEEFVVQHSGSQVVVLATCMRPKLIIESFFNESTLDIPYEDFGLETVFNITGAIAFKNSYGYLPGLMWGLLPFSGGISLAYILSLMLFVVLVICNRPSLIRLHYFILVVLILMTVETVLWFVTYWQLNATGEAICCPYPPLILASTAMKVVSKLVARVLTTIICLGYGIARPHLTVPETGLVVGLALCYIVSTGVLEILHLSNQAQGNMEPPVVWEALAIATDGCFAGWIFASLVLTRKTLRRTGQTAKYQMYDILFKVLVVFMVLAFAFTLFENAVYAKRIESFPWEYLWMLWAGSRLLNFAVIVVVSIIWRPTQTSFLYANSMQLPSSEDDCAKQDVVSQDSPGIQEIVVEEEKKSEDAV